MDKNKKIGLGLIGAIFLIILLVLSFTIKSNDVEILSNDPEEIMDNAQKESAAIKENEMREFTKISVDTFLDYYKENAVRIVIFARPSCQYCEIAEPIIKNIAYKNNLVIYYVNTEEINETGRRKLEEANDFFKTLGTPTLLIIENNTIKEYIDGLTDKAHYNDFLRRNNFIK